MLNMLLFTMEVTMEVLNWSTMHNNAIVVALFFLVRLHNMPYNAAKVTTHAALFHV